MYILVLFAFGVLFGWSIDRLILSRPSRVKELDSTLLVQAMRIHRTKKDMEPDSYERKNQKSLPCRSGDRDSDRILDVDGCRDRRYGQNVLQLLPGRDVRRD